MCQGTYARVAPRSGLAVKKMPFGCNCMQDQSDACPDFDVSSALFFFTISWIRNSGRVLAAC